MKKLTKVLVAMSLAAVLAVNTFAASTIKVEVNGTKISLQQKPYSSAGTTYVPLKLVSDVLGASASYNSKIKEVTIKKDYNTIVLRVKDLTARVNNRIVKLTAPAEIKNNTVYVPLKFVADSLGVKATADIATSTIQLTTDYTVNIPDSLKVKDPVKESITKYGKAFKGAWNGGRYSEVIVITKDQLPIHLDERSVVDIHYNGKNLEVVYKSDDVANKYAPEIYLSDENGMCRGRGATLGKIFNSENGTVTGVYAPVTSFDDDKNYKNYSFKRVKYFVFPSYGASYEDKTDDYLVAIPASEVN